MTTIARTTQWAGRRPQCAAELAEKQVLQRIARAPTERLREYLAAEHAHFCAYSRVVRMYPDEDIDPHMHPQLRYLGRRVLETWRAAFLAGEDPDWDLPASEQKMELGLEKR